MKFQLSAIAALAATATAFPRMQEMREQLVDLEIRTPTAEPEPQGSSSPAASLGDLIPGLLGSVTKGTLDLSNKRPEPGYRFIAPGPGDSRGPCPGLNLLANHGYLPRNGYVNAAQILEATSRGFNMGQDLATVLIIFAVLSDGSITEESWWLGTNPANGIGGLNRHSTVESDISPNREDFYNGCGDNHHVSSRMFERNVRIVSARPTKQFDIPAMAQHFSAQADFAKTYNPTLYYFPFPLIVSIVAYNFYPRFFANGTNELGGVANYESISSIIGAKYDKKSGHFEYVPETWPSNWYRRAIPYTAEQALLEGFTMVYPANPVLPPGFLQITGNQFNFTNFACDFYQGLNSITPLALAGDVTAAEHKLSWAFGMLDKAFGNTVLGCHRNTISKNYYPKQKNLGGPLNPGPAAQKNAGNNVYNKIYFKEPPYQRTCAHSFNP